MGMGYVNVPGLTAEVIAAGHFEIEVAREQFEAEASLSGFYDPTGERMRG